MAVERVRVLRVIARMNMGGPAYHVSLLSGRLDPTRYETLLLTGQVGPGEASLEELAERYGAKLRVVGSLGPELRPAADARALREIAGIVRSFRPHIVHTHTAKAGFVARFAALVVGRARSSSTRTTGTFLRATSVRFGDCLFRSLERARGSVSDRLIGVSSATVDDLVRLRVAPRAKFASIPIGLELDGFAESLDELGATFRAEVARPERMWSRRSSAVSCRSSGSTAPSLRSPSPEGSEPREARDRRRRRVSGGSSRLGRGARRIRLRDVRRLPPRPGGDRRRHRHRRLQLR